MSSAFSHADAAPRLVLASSSIYRRRLLTRLNTPFDWLAPDIDERPLPAETPEAQVVRLSINKARAVAPAFRRHLIIGSDQVALNGARVIGKPGDRARAIEQLESASGRTVKFLTGLCLFDPERDDHDVAIVPCDVVFRDLSRAQIEAYVDTEHPYDCAASFKSEGLGTALVERIICEDPTALMGLPLIKLVSMLATAGVDVAIDLPRDAVRADRPSD